MAAVGGHRERLQKSIGLMMVGFRAGTSITTFDVFSDTAAKTRPKIITGYEFVRLRDAIMAGSGRIVAAVEDFELQVKCRDVEKTFMKKKAVLGSVRGWKSSMKKLFVQQASLCFILNLFKKGRRKGWRGFKCIQRQRGK